MHIPKKHGIVSVRKRRYLVREVSKDKVPRVSLVCLDDDAPGEPLEVYWDVEVDRDAAPVGTDFQSFPTRGLDDPKVFAAWLNAMYWQRVTATNPNLFQSPYRAGIEVKAYQLEPLKMALNLPRVNLFIADDVGLGKTIEAGLILRELLSRQRVSRFVVAAPPSVVQQWKEELEERFGLHCQVYDRAFVKRMRRERGLAVNPWTTHSRFIISHALLREDDYFVPLCAWLDALKDDRLRAPNTLLILDEAHHAAPASASHYAVDSKFTKKMRTLAPLFEHRLFLSATPHNGHENSYTALMELLDPQRFVQGVRYSDKEFEARRKDIVVRRLKDDLRALKVPGFPQRVVEPVVIEDLPEDAPELELARLFQAYWALREEAVKGTTGKAQVKLLLMGLQKRLLSSVPAFLTTLQCHIRGLKQQGMVSDQELAAFKRMDRGVDRDSYDATEEEVALADSADAVVETQEQTAFLEMSRGLSLGDEEKRLLARMEQLARAHREAPDAKVRALIDWIRAHCCPTLGQKNAAWTPRRLLIFTEYTTTKTYLQRCLERAIEGSDRAADRIRTFVGGMSDDLRQDLKTAFNAPPEENHLRILIATDTAREGVNLQNHCYDLFHFDVPWNPARMEQRNGRLDRKLQRNDTVYCRYFYYAQRREDEVLKRLVQKSQTILRQLGTMTSVVNRELEDLMADGIQPKRYAKMVAALKQVGENHKPTLEDLAAAKAREGLPERLEALRGDLAASRTWLCLEDDALRKTLSTALVRQGGPALTRGEDDGSWLFPDAQALAAAGPNWEKTLDTLRKPRKAKEKPWDWRRENPVRPVVFEDTGNMDGKQVHLHLEHRVSTRLLKTLRTAHAGLHRMTVVPTNRVTAHHLLLFWRLSLYGRNAGRLHDDILCRAAVWHADGRVTPCDAARSEALRAVLFAAMNDGDSDSGDLYRDLPRKLPPALAQLVPPMREAVQDAGRAAEAELKRRAESEAGKMKRLIDGQRTFLEARIAQGEHPEKQDAFAFLKDDPLLWQQFIYECDHWKNRLAKLDEEREEEPRRIREDYKVAKVHDEPLAIAWLWAV